MDYLTLPLVVGGFIGTTTVSLVKTYYNARGFQDVRTAAKWGGRALATTAALGGGKKVYDNHLPPLNFTNLLTGNYSSFDTALPTFNNTDYRAISAKEITLSALTGAKDTALASYQMTKEYTGYALNLGAQEATEVLGEGAKGFLSAGAEKSVEGFFGAIRTGITTGVAQTRITALHAWDAIWVADETRTDPATAFWKKYGESIKSSLTDLSKTVSDNTPTASTALAVTCATAFVFAGYKVYSNPSLRNKVYGSVESAKAVFSSMIFKSPSESKLAEAAPAAKTPVEAQVAPQPAKAGDVVHAQSEGGVPATEVTAVVASPTKLSDTANPTSAQAPEEIKAA